MGSRPENKLLAALPLADYSRIQPHLRTSQVAEGGHLSGCGTRRVYFPATTVSSIRQKMGAGASIELTTVGSEGLVGYPNLTGDDKSQAKEYVQITDGLSLFMPLDVFEIELARGEALKRITDRYAQSFLESLMRAASCNRLHSLQERCCRWLLLIHDRIGRSRFQLSNSSLLLALGASRQQLAAVLKTLENMEVVRLERGTVWIRDAGSLARLACDCYPRLHRLIRLEQLPRVEEPEAPAEPEGPGPAGGARVIQLRPLAQCPRCGNLTVSPHVSERECLRALDAEMRLLMQRSRALHRTRERIARDWLDVVRGFLDRERIKSS